MGVLTEHANSMMTMTWHRCHITNTHRRWPPHPPLSLRMRAGGVLDFFNVTMASPPLSLSCSKCEQGGFLLFFMQ
jgi:hypothetical protein